MILTYDDRFLIHDMKGHPECADRLRSIIKHLQKTDLWNKLIHVPVRESDENELRLIHSNEHIKKIKTFCQQGGGWLDADTYALSESFTIAKLATGALLCAIDEIAKECSNKAFCAIRPPGHHATPTRAMGFCLFNNIAIGARYIQKMGWGEKILIFDWDVHHGNGTQDAFWQDSSIGYFSLHRHPFYPASGAKNEVGESEGKNYNCNLPIPSSMPVEQIMKDVEKKIHHFADQLQPDWVLISCGFDAYIDDPIGGLGFNESSYRQLTGMAVDIANQYSKGRVVSVLEGGYNLSALGPLTETHIRAMEEMK